MTHEERVNKFKAKVVSFNASPKEAKDLFDFAIAVYSATSWGSGLTFDQIEAIIKTCMDGDNTSKVDA